MTEPTKSVDVAFKPCPFCGSADLSDPVTEQVEYNSWSGSITCNSCDTEVGTSYTEPSVEDATAQIIKQWNTRTPPGESGLREALDRAIETLAASRHLIGKYVPDHHWLPEHDKRIADLRAALSSPTDRT